MYSEINFPSLSSTKLGFQIDISDNLLEIKPDYPISTSLDSTLIGSLLRRPKFSSDMIGKIIPYKIKTVEYSSYPDYQIILRDSDGNVLTGRVSHLYSQQWSRFVNILNEKVYPFLLKEMIINISNGDVLKLGNISIGKGGIFFEKFFSSSRVSISWDMIVYKVDYGQLKIRHVARAYKSIECLTISIKNSILIPLLIEFMREAHRKTIAPEFLLYECYPVLLRL